MKIEGSENVRDIFSIFHDGSIVAWSMNGNALMLEVEIKYLAERINPGHRKFTVRLFEINDISFSTWPGDLKSAPAVLLSVGDIFEADLEILEGNIKDGQIEVVCNQHAPNLPYCGGELRFKCAAAQVNDEGGHPYSIDELGILCKGYWDDWSKRSKA
jgi:hypothetical protein